MAGENVRGTVGEEGRDRTIWELYKVFRDRENMLLNNARNVVQVFLTMLAVVLAATLAGFSALGPNQPWGLVTLGGPAVVVFVCWFANAATRVWMESHSRNNAILRNLEGLLSKELTDSIFPLDWSSQRRVDEVRSGLERSIRKGLRLAVLGYLLLGGAIIYIDAQQPMLLPWQLPDWAGNGAVSVAGLLLLLGEVALFAIMLRVTSGGKLSGTRPPEDVPPAAINPAGYG